MYGADAMRFNLLTLVTNNQDVKFDANIDKKTHELVDSPRTEAARSFVTKIWNAARFVMLNMDGYEPGEPQAATAADAWILSRLAKLTASVTAGIEEYRFGDVARELYAFFWNEFCDWYIELCKARLSQDGETRLVAQRNLVFVLDSALRLLHPVMPFVTEAIWEYLPVEDDAPALMVAAWPDAGDLSCWIDDEAEQAIQLVVQLVTSVRATRAAYGISPRQELAVTLRFADDDEDALAKRALVERQRDLIMALAKLSSLDIIEADAPRPQNAASISWAISRCTSACPAWSILPRSASVSRGAAPRRSRSSRNSIRSSATRTSSTRPHPRPSKRSAPSMPSSRRSSSSSRHSSRSSSSSERG